MSRRISQILTGILLLSVILFGSGCAGLVGGYSLSPASFLLPGLIHVDPPEERDEVEDNLYAVSEALRSRQMIDELKP